MVETKKPRTWQEMEAELNDLLKDHKKPDPAPKTKAAPKSNEEPMPDENLGDVIKRLLNGFPGSSKKEGQDSNQ